MLASYNLYFPSDLSNRAVFGSNQYWTPVHVMPTIDTEQKNSITRSSSGESHDRSDPISSPTAKVCRVRTATNWRIAPCRAGSLWDRYYRRRIGRSKSKCPEAEHGAKFADCITIAAIVPSSEGPAPEPTKSDDNSASQPGSIGSLSDGRTGRCGPLNRAETHYGNFGSRFSKKAASPSAAASVVRAVALTAAPAVKSVARFSPIVSFSSRFVSNIASGAHFAISPAI
jgi:hypothetical protein